MTTMAVDLEVRELVRFFGAGGQVIELPTQGKTVQELAGLPNERSSIFALQTFKVIRGGVPLPDREAVPVKSEEFDHSPKYFIDGKVLPIAKVREHYNPFTSEVVNPRWGVETRFGFMVFERERPEVITLS